MINAVGREIPEEILKMTGKEAFKGSLTRTTIMSIKRRLRIGHALWITNTEQDGGKHP